MTLPEKTSEINMLRAKKQNQKKGGKLIHLHFHHNSFWVILWFSRALVGLPGSPDSAKPLQLHRAPLHAYPQCPRCRQV